MRMRFASSREGITQVAGAKAGLDVADHDVAIERSERGSERGRRVALYQNGIGSCGSEDSVSTLDDFSR